MALSIPKSRQAKSHPKSMPCGHWNYWLNSDGTCDACARRFVTTNPTEKSGTSKVLR